MTGAVPDGTGTGGTAVVEAFEPSLLVGIDVRFIWRKLLVWRKYVEPPSVIPPPDPTVVTPAGSAPAPEPAPVEEPVSSGPVVTEAVDIEQTFDVFPRYDLDAARWVAAVWSGRLRCLTDLGDAWRLWDAPEGGAGGMSDVQGCGVFVDDGGSVIPQILGAVADAFMIAIDRIDLEYENRAKRKSADMMASGVSEDEAKAAAAEVREVGRKMWRPWRIYAERLRTEAGQNALASRLRGCCATNWRAFDADVRWLAFRNGVVDLDRLRALSSTRTGSGHGGTVTFDDIRLEPHSPERLITQVAGVDWKPEEAGRATLTGGGWAAWDQALERALPSPDLRFWLRRALGGALLGRPEKRLMNLVGVSNSGKSMMLGVCKSVWGSYVVNCNVALFIKNEKVDAFEMDGLRLARIVTASEPDKGGAWNAGLLKQITGLDPITTRGMYRSHASSGGEWLPRFSLWVASNYVMRFPADDRALTMRLTPIPFKHRFRLDIRDGGTEEVPEAERLDRDLPVRLVARGKDGFWAAEGFAAWCMTGLIEWLNGSGSGVEAAETMHERSNMIEEVDNVLAWVRSCVEDGTLAVTQYAASEVLSQPWVDQAVVDWSSVGGGRVKVPGSSGSGSTGLAIEEAYWTYRRWWEDEYGSGGDVVGGGGGRWAKKKAAFVEVLTGWYGAPTKTVGRRRFPGLVTVIGRWKPEPGPGSSWTGMGGGPGPGWGEGE